MGGDLKYDEDPGLTQMFFYQLGCFVLLFAGLVGFSMLTIIHLFVLPFTHNFKMAGELIGFTLGVGLGLPFYITWKNLMFIWRRIVRISLGSRGDGAFQQPEQAIALVDVEMGRTLYHDLPLEGETSIRLLRIYPSHDFGDRLVLELEASDLTNAPSYDALSYTWGDEIGNSERTCSIQCNHGTEMWITKNCETAIRRLRLPKKERLIWVDAVCIDQISNIERTHQVSIMSKIYKSARHIMVYTGEGTTNTDRLFDWLNSIDENELHIETPWKLGDLNWSRLRELDGPLRGDAWQKRIEFLIGDVLSGVRRRWQSMTVSKKRIHLADSEVQTLVVEYCSRRWFTRVWVLQEVALPPLHRIRVMCGTRLTTAERALHAISQLQDEAAKNILDIFLLFRQRIKNPKRSHLLDILIATRDRQANDARDKIFALLSIAQHMDESKFPELRADYGKSTQEVFADFSFFFIQHHGPTLFLSLIKSSSQLVPSWAADWTLPWPNNKAIVGRAFAAGLGSRSSLDKTGVELDEADGTKCLLLTRPKILRGYFTYDGHIDGSQGTKIVQVENLAEDEVLVQMRPGIAALLKRRGDDYSFMRICPHALSIREIGKLVDRWSTVVAGEGEEENLPFETLALGSANEYLDIPQTFRIQ